MNPLEKDTRRSQTDDLVGSLLAAIDGTANKHLVILRLLLYPSIVALLLLTYWFLGDSPYADPTVAKEFVWVGLTLLPLTYLLELAVYQGQKRGWNVQPLYLVLVTLFVLCTTYATQLNGTLTNYMVTFYAILIAFSRLLLGSGAARLATAVAIGSYIIVVVLEQLGVIPYARLLWPLYTSQAIEGPAFATITIVGVSAFLLLTYLGVGFLTRRLNEREQALARVTDALSDRTQELSEALEELKAAEAQVIESEMQANIGRLVAGILHEVNSPLGTMRSSVDTIEKAFARSRPVLTRLADNGDAAAGKTLRVINAGVELTSNLKASNDRIIGVLDTLKRFVSLDEAESKPVNVCVSLDDARALLRPMLGDRITVVTRYPETPALVRCFPAKLNRVFLNLLQNAISAIDNRGEIRISVKRERGQIEVELTDNGRGIPASKLDQLFDLGFTEKCGRIGLQLGLPQSKRWVNEIGGQIHIASREGRGTSVHIFLPADRLTTSVHAAQPSD